MQKNAKSPTPSWVLVNGLFLAIIVLGFVTGHTASQVVFYLFAGSLAVLMTLCLLAFKVIEVPEESLQHVREKGHLTGAPASLDMGYDFSVLTILTLASAWPAVILYAIMLILQHRFHNILWAAIQERTEENT